MITFTVSKIFNSRKLQVFASMLFLFTMLGGIKQAQATHAAGADLTYKCLGGNQYLIEVTFYRDCGGVAEPANVPVTYRSASLGQNLTVTANKISGTGLEITIPCQASASTCNGGSGTGIRKFVYQATVTLPGAASDWIFSYHVCCRNCAITTIQNPCGNSTEIYVEATLNNLLASCNSSPTFSNIPVAFVCTGQTFNYNHGVTDQDGDSLAYEFITPKISATQNVTFIPPATATNPVSSSTPFTLNPVTGQITFTPNQIQIGIMAIRVKEYRNGQLIGTVIRDMQVYTTICANNLPNASGINNTSNYTINTCVNQQICFDVFTADADAVQNVTLTTNNGIAGATYTISGGSRPSLHFCWTPAVSHIDLSPHSFTVTVQDNACPNNGVQTYSYSIYVTGPDFTLNSTNITCNGSNNGIATAVPVYAGPQTYLWSSGQTTSSINNLAPGTYTVTLTNGNGCTISKSVTITQPVALTTSTSQTNISCAGLCNGAIDLTALGGTGAYTYLWSGGQTTQDLNSKCIGTYTVTVTDANNCTTTKTVTLSNVSNMSASIAGTNVFCNAGSSGAADLTISGGVIPYSYVWSNSATTQDLNGVVSGNYTVTVTDGNSCTKTASVTITQPAAALNNSITSSTNVSCYSGSNGAINLTVTGGTTPYTYQWSNGATTQDLTLLAAGSYTVTVTDANGCASTTSSINITQPIAALSSSTSSTNNVSCFGGNNGSINLSVTGGTSPYSYNWSNGVTTQDLTNIITGIYSVTVTDANGCTDITSGVTITQPAASLSASASSTNNVSCFGGTNGSINLNVSGGTLPYSYNWSNGASSQNLSNIPAGSYTVTITDAQGCAQSVSAISISQPAAVLNSTVTSSNSVSCFGGTNGAINLTVNGGTAPYTYSWSNGATTQDLNNVIAGTYAVTVSDANGCTTANSGISITQPVATLSSNASSTSNVSCFGGNNGSINLNVSGGTTPYTYNWSNGATIQDLNNIPSGSYSVIVTDAQGCTTSTTGLIISQPAAALSSSNTHVNVLCRGNATGSIDLNTSGGTPPYTYNWSNGANSQDLTNIAAGTYTVTITDDNGCILLSSAITVTQPLASLSGTATTTGNVACNSGANGAVNLTVTGGTAPYAYSWSNGATTQDISGLFAGNYVVTITDANGCTTNSSSIVTQPAGALSSTINTSQNISCYGGNNGSINLSVNGGTTPYTYTWSNGVTTQDISGLSSGSYTVTVTDANSCINVSTAIVSQPSASLSSGATSTIDVSCFGGSNGTINLTVTGGTIPYSFNWSNGSNSEDLSGLAAGNYSVTVTDANGCTTQTSAITISQPPVALNSNATSTNNVSCFGGTNGAINLTVTGGTLPYSYNWNTGDNTQDLNNLSAGSYTVMVTDANGCTTQTSAITISQPSAVLSSSTSSSNNVSCFGGINGSITLSVSGGTAPYSYNWSNGAITQNLNSIPAGTYSVIITDAQGCTTATSGVSITQPAAALSSNVSTQNNVSCFGGNNGAINLTVNGGTIPYTYNWSNGATSQDLNNAPVGTYTVTITDANGCTTNNSGLQITQPAAALNSNANSTTSVSCYGGSNGGINLTVSGGTTPYNYQWSNGANTQNLSNISAGSYTVTVTDINGCTAITSAIIISEPAAALSSLVNATNNVSCFGGANGSVTLNVTGGTAPYTFIWSNGSNSQNLSNVAAGSYSVIISDANGCTTSESAIVISQPQGALSASISTSQNVSCFSGANGFIDLTVNGGTIPYSYNWSNGANTQDISSLSAGSYTVTITDDNGCTFNQFGSITQPSSGLAASSTVSQNVSCFGGNNASITLTVNGGTAPYSYNWSNGSTTQNINNLPAGTYTVTVSDANGCTAVQANSVSQPSAALSATSSVSQNVSCYFGSNGSITVTVSGGTVPYTYAWNNGASTQNLSGLSAGTYTVIVTDVNGCTALQSQTVTQPAAGLSASTIITQNVSCFAGVNGSIDLVVFGGTPPYSFSWSNGAITEDVTNLAAGTYTVSITDANGCTLSQNGTITQPTASISATATVTQNVSCYSGANGSINVTVNGGTVPYIFNWSNGASTEDLTNLSAGTYTVSITDANGCTFSQIATITQPAGALSASSVVTGNISCFSGNNGSIDLTVTGGTTPYSYNWNTGATSEDLTGLSAGTYSVIITDANGCTTTNSATITQPAGSLSTSINVSQNVSCFGGNNGLVDLTVSGGTTPYNYIWSNGATTEDLNNLASGIYTATITDANGCFSSVTATINQPVYPLGAIASVTQNVSCNGGSNASINLTVSGGTTPYSYVWSNGASTEDLNNLSSGTYTVSITDANGCTQTTTATITQPSAALSASASVAQNVSCFAGANGSIDLTVSGGTTPYSYSWSNGANTEDISGLISGTYFVNITDANGCTQTSSATISQPAATLSASTSITQNVSCFAGANGSIDLTVNGGTLPYTFNWSNGANSEDISNLIAGTYTVSITDANGCTASQSGTISQPVSFLSALVSITQNVSCNSGTNGSIDLTVSGGTLPYTFSWSNGAITEDINNLPAGTYTVTITDANGCTSSQTGTITQPAAALSSSASVTQNVSCNSGTNGSIDLTVTGGTIPYTFNWSNGANTEDISNLSAGTYTVSVTDANGCTSSQTGTITQPAAALSASASVTQNVNCYAGTNGSIDLTVTGGTAPYTFNWNNGATSEDINNLAAGIYTVNITDANGCTFTQSGTINQPTAALSSSTTVTGNISCFSGNNGSIDLTVSGGTTPYTFMWNTGSTTEDISGLSAGTYFVTITDVNGCTAADSATITQPAGALATNVSITQQVSCFGGANGSIDLTVTGGTQPYTYTWSNGANTEDLSNLSAGVYTVTIFDVNGCNASVTATIAQPSAALNAGASATVNVSCNGGSNGSIDLTATDGTSPYTYQWSNGETTEDIINLSTGTYTVTVTDANGCTISVSAFIAQPGAALNATANVTQNVNCFGGANGSIDLTATDGTAPYTYSWSNGETTEDINNLITGTYTVTVTDANGCTFTVSATISQPIAPLNAAAIVTQNVNCFTGATGAIDLTVTDGTPPYTFIWNNGETTEDISNLNAGTYTVTVTDANGCVTTAAATVTQPAGSLTATVSVTQNVNCFGGSNGSIDLTVTDGTAPYTYNWNNGETTEDIDNLSAGTYTVTVTDTLGCTFTISANISQPNAPLNGSAIVTQNVSCNAGTNGAIDLTIVDGTPPYTYNWSNGQTTEDISNLAAGTYTVIVTDANGCTFTTSLNVTQPAAALSTNINITQNVSCFAGANGSIDLTVTDGTPPYTFIWSNGSTTEDINNLISGTYTVTITDANGCTAIATGTITQPAASLSAGTSVTQNVSCNGGSNGSITLTVNGGTAPYTYNWSNGDTTQNISNLSSGNYVVTITDANGCTAIASAAITQPAAALNASLGITQNVSCNAGSDGSIDLTVSGGTGPYAYNWSNGATTEDIANLTAGTYTVTVTDANNCTTVSTATITQPTNALSVSANGIQSVSCFGGSNGTITLTVAGGTAPYTYNWSNGATTQDLNNIPSGTYIVTVTDVNGCTQTATVTVTQPASSLSVSGSGSTSNCLTGVTGSVNIGVNGGTAPFTYNWSNGATTQNLGNQGAGSYTVTVTDANGCTATGNYTITDISSFNANAAGPTTICMGELATLVADSIPGATYQWYLNGQVLGGAIYNIFVTPAAGSYTVTVTNSCGSFSSNAIIITVHTIDNITTSGNVIICPGESTQLSASGGVSYEWTPANGLDYTNVPNPVASPLQTTVYTVTVTNDVGCKTTGTIEVGVLCDTLIIPSGFSPNDDGTNDGFEIVGIEHYPGNKIWIYNRWGNLIYKTHDYENKWKGESNVSGIYIGKKVPAGTYFYILDLNNHTKPLQGYIVLRY